MDFLGKREYRIRVPKQIGLDPEMALIIHKYAERDARSYEMQIVFMLAEFIRNDGYRAGNEDNHRDSQGAAYDSTQQHMATQPRSARHTAARNERRTA